jgi:uncharacterized protein (TIRG00374 family)
MKPSRIAFTVLSFAAMIGASVWVVARNWPAGGMPWLAWQAHLAAIAATVFEITTRAFKIQASAKAVRLDLGFGTALRVCLGGDFAAAITPARSGAEPSRYLILAESGINAGGRVVILFLELFLEMISLVVVCSLLAFMFAGRGASASALIALVGGYSTFVLIAGTVGLVLSRRNSNGPPAVWARRVGIGAGVWRRVQMVLRSIRSSVSLLRYSRPGMMLLALGGSILHVCFKVTALPVLVFLGDRTFALTMDSLAPLVLYPLALFYGGVVVPAPGGGGFIEGAFAATLKDAIPATIFAASLIWWRFYTFYVYIVVGGLAAGNAALRAIRRRDAAASA